MPGQTTTPGGRSSTPYVSFYFLRGPLYRPLLNHPICHVWKSPERWNYLPDL
ncbi:hypothetical protein M413DRAFT_442920 [Hebeloma cylindrosporum]|uniref:Uncharacterized protein n=1 Tax=Hebeloma cylindrosporum TaxID=76867 RepID=A0A0C3C7W8_HEBCY|nr:hypothetical protein M413DRAFT_442920 [Hebeloma cylindrosporum h7]